MSDLVQRLMALFEGFSEAYGTHGETYEGPGGKIEIKGKGGARTVRQPVTLDLWYRHVAGAQPLGMMPLRDDNTCLWGAIDVDIYDISFADMVDVVERRGLPLLPARTKSGGVHLYLFMAEAAPAKVMQTRLREMAALLGYGTAEVFPKQHTVDFAKGDLPNWLNMPYFGGDDSDRYGLKKAGSAMTLAEFVAAAESMRRPRAFLDRSFRKVTEVDDATARQRRDPNFGDGPPCLQHLTTEGFPEGTRNKGLFALGVFAKKKYGARWEEVLEGWNREYMNPPLPSSEVVQIIRSLNKSEYRYSCKEHPLSAHCNSALCRTRRFGVGGEDEYPRISGMSVIKTNPPLWFVDVDDRRIELSTDQLQNYVLFHKACMENLFVCYKMMKPTDWLMVVSEAMRNAVELDTPIDVGNQGHFMELLEDFVMNRHRGENLEDLLVGRPYEDVDEQRHYFRLRDLMLFLDRAGFKTFSRVQITTRIKQLGGDKRFFNLRGNKGVNTWWIPSLFTPMPTVGLPPLKREPV